MQKKLIIANWKMEKSDGQALDWCRKYTSNLIELIKQKRINFVLCPSASFLFQAQEIFQDTNILLGAQDCGPADRGSYTGDISVLTLQERAVKYCILGHSERRSRYCEDNSRIAQKVELVLRHYITPIICVGETAQERDNNETEAVLRSQIRSAVDSIQNKNCNLCIAYEPIWAIGTGRAASLDIVRSVVEYIKKINSDLENTQILYGGSVNQDNADQLAEIVNLDGFLIGKASLDFQMLKKIVLSIK